VSNEIVKNETNRLKKKISNGLTKLRANGVVIGEFLAWLIDWYFIPSKKERRKRAEDRKIRKFRKIQNRFVEDFGYENVDPWLAEAHRIFLEAKKTGNYKIIEDWRIRNDPTHPAHFNRNVYGTPEARLLKAYHEELRSFQAELSAYRRMKKNELGSWNFTILICEESILVLNSEEGLGLDWIDERDFHKIHEEYRKGGDLTKFRCGKLNHSRENSLC